MKKLKYISLLGLVLISMFALKAVVHAAPGGRNEAQGYFDGKYPSGSDWDNVFTDGIPSNVNTKKEFISWVEDKLNDSGRNHTGAAFIINLMLGRSGSSADRSPGSGCTSNGINCVTEWENRINDGGISIHRGNISWGSGKGNDISGWNSAYAPDINDELFYGDSGSHTAIYFTNSAGKILFVVKTDCGNPLGNLAGLPHPAPNHPPTGKIDSVSCTLNESAKPVYTFVYEFKDSDADGDAKAAAFLSSGQYDADDTAHAVSGSYDTDTTSPYTGEKFNVPAYTGAWPGGSHYVWLRVADIHPDGSHTWVTIDKSGVPAPACPKAGAPNGTLSASCTAGGVSYSGSFYDPNGATTAKVTGGGFNDSYTSAASNKSAATAKPVSHSNTTHPAGTVTITMVVQDSKGSSNATIKATATCPGGVTADCPGDPTIAGNANVTVLLPDKTPSDYLHGSGSPGSYSLSPNQTYYQDNTQNKTKITSVADNSPSLYGGGSVTISPVAPDSVGNFTATPNQTKLNYKPYTTQYPYDNNVAQVAYTSTYNEYTWKSASSASGYLCSGVPQASSTCTRNDSYNPCAGAYAGHDGNCYVYNGYYPDSSGKCAVGIKSSTGACVNVAAASCYKGGTLSSQPSNSSVGQQGEYCTLYTHYTGTPYYSWTRTSGPATKTAAGTASGYTMQACYPRNFDVTGVSTTAQLSPNSEDPSSGAGTNTSATVSFSVSHGGALRKAFSVNGLTYGGDVEGDSGLTCTPSGTAAGSFNVTTAITAASGTASASIPDVNCIVSQPAPIGGTVCAGYDVTPGGSTVDQNGTIVNNDGTTVSGNDCSVPVHNEPYLKVFGGDAAAGINFTNAGSCSSNTSAKITTFNKGASPYNGAGVELAALALNTIDGFASAQGGINPSPPKGLSFANSLANPYGGSFGGNPGCSPDYYSAAAGTTISGNVDLSSLAAGSYQASGPITLSGTVPSGTQVAIYSRFGVYIDDDITYDNLGNDVSKMPSFTLVVKSPGSGIFVGGNVSTLYGNYISQGGIISDCAPSIGSSYGASTYDNCGNKLNVHGTFIANNIKFYRMGDQGSLRYSDADTAASNNASEEFDYTPVSWLAQPPTHVSTPNYDAVTSLPPVL